MRRGLGLGWMLAVLFLASLLLSACGGGGGGGSTPSPVGVAITSQPVDVTTTAGHSVQFTVTGSNASAYQWQSNAGQGWTDISGATGSAYQIAAATLAMSGEQFRVIVSGGGSQVTSSSVTLRVSQGEQRPAIIAQPLDVSVTTGQDAVFSVTATGTTLSYQWQTSSDATTWMPVAGATEPLLRLPSADASRDGLYRVVISNSEGTVTSASVRLTVSPLPVTPAISSQPTSVTVQQGQSATFSVVASGTPIPDLQWQSSPNGSVWTDITGATGPSYTVSGASLTDSGTRFRAVATNDAGTTVSAAATLTVTLAEQAPVFSVQPQNASAAQGSSASFDGQVSGSPTPTLQWQWSSDGIDWYNINAATSASYTVPSVSGADNGSLYRLVATNEAGVAESQAAALSVTDGTGSGPSLALLYGALGGAGGLDGSGSDARLNSPWGLVFDSHGNLLVTDSDGDTVRRMAADGTLTTIAGIYGGAEKVDGTGLASRFAQPLGLAIDRADNLYVIDGEVLRKMTSSGTVTTVTSLTAPQGLVVDSATGFVYVCVWHGIALVSPTGAVSMLAGNASFSYPVGIAWDGQGGLLVTDAGDNVVRRVTKSGDLIAAYGAAGTSGSADGVAGVARFNQPWGITVDAAGNAFVTDRANRTIREVSSQGVVSTVAGAPGVAGLEDGANAAARFNDPKGVALSPSGDLYVADSEAIRKIGGGVVTTVAGLARYTGNLPSGVAADAAGNIYWADSYINTIRKYAVQTSAMENFAGGQGSGAADGAGSVATFNGPQGMTADSAGNLYVADAGNHLIRKVSPQGDVSTLAGSAGLSGSTDGSAAAARFNAPMAVAADGSGNVFVADTGNNAIRKIAQDGTVTTFSGLAGAAGYANGTASVARYCAPNSVAVDPSGGLFVSDQSGVIRHLDATGAASALAGSPQSFGSKDGSGSDARFSSYVVLAYGNGVLYAADGGTVRRIDPATGAVTTLAGVAGQVGMRIGVAPRFNGITGLVVIDAHHLAITTANEQSVLELTL